MSRTAGGRGPAVLRSGLVALGFAAAACAGESGSAREADSLFVEVMARLHRVPAEIRGEGPAAAARQAEDSARAAILAEHGISADSLLRFAERAGSDPARMAALWSAVARRVEELGGGAEPDDVTGKGAGRRRPGREAGAAEPGQEVGEALQVETGETHPREEGEPVSRTRPGPRRVPTPPPREAAPRVTPATPEPIDTARVRELLRRRKERPADP